ncbi:MAG: zinc ribbon domain-containing protein [Chthoniobacterales bacterium]
MAKPKTPEFCPVCSEAVPRGALACPECGADDRSGWRDDAAAADGLDLPDADFDYERFVREEFGSSPKPPGLRAIWWITALVLLLALGALYFYAR